MEEKTLVRNSIDILQKPRLAFLGVGWIGRNRMEAIAGSSLAQVSAIADADIANSHAAAAGFPDATVFEGYKDILADPSIDGIVIATPSALHAEQVMLALQAGKAVFCQKPLARNFQETQNIVAAARDADKLLAVDFSYRYTKAMQSIARLVESGALGKIYAVQLTFHNAYGPDKPWFYDPKLSGGGCVMDLGIHLVDLALWILHFPDITGVESRLYQKGKAMKSLEGMVEDYAFSSIDLADGCHLNLNCSWNLPAGKEAVIEAVFYGTNGGAAFRNVNGSFYDFTAEHFTGTKTETLFAGKDNWGGQAGISWVKKLASGAAFDEQNYDFLKIAALIDQIYRR